MRGRLGVIALAAAVVATAITMPAAQAAGKRVVIGKISQNVAKQLPRLQAMAEAMSIALKPYGVEGVDVRVVASEHEAEVAMRNGEVDMFSETIFGALGLERAGVGKIELAEWKSGKREYHTVFFARKGAAQGLDGLRGKKVAFQEPGSTSGYYLPRFSMEQRGIKLVQDG